MQSQKAVTVYFSSKQLLPCGFAEHYTVAQSQKAVAAYISSEQL